MRAPLYDYYAVLGVERDVGLGQLRRTYRLLALEFHPDRAGIQSTEVFQRIAEAYRVLSDAAARAAYDERLRAAERSRFGQRRDVPRAGSHDVTEGEAYGPGGKIGWRRGGEPKRDPHRVDDLIDRLCGPLETLLERAVARRCEDGAIELRLEPHEAKVGGTAAIDISIEVACPTCFGGAREGRLWCRRCEYAGVARENVTVCVEISAAVEDGAAFTVDTDPAGRAAPMRVRVRHG